MITPELQKEFIPHKQSLILKKMGFNEECMSVYSEEGKLSPLQNFPVRNSNVPSYCTAPIYRQVFKWFRDKYNIHGNVAGRYLYEITGIGDNKALFSIEFETYEQAELNCIDKLIEIAQGAESDK